MSSVSFHKTANAVATPSVVIRRPAEAMLLVAGTALLMAVVPVLGLISGRQMKREALEAAGILAVYAVFVATAGKAMCEVRARGYVLLIAFVAGIFLPASLAFNALTDQAAPWPAWIPMWLGIPVVVWVLRVLFREDVQAAFDDVKNRASRSTAVSDEPRLSRCSLIGAIWTALGIVASIIWVLWNHFYAAPPTPATDVLVAQVREIVYYTPKWPVFFFAITAPFAAMILGGIAIGHIKRSGGKIGGLPLAVADVLFFPLLLLGSIVAFPCALVSGAFAPHPNAAALAMSVAFGVLGASVACFGVGRAVWRAIAGVTPPTPAVASTTSAEPRLSRLALWGAIWAGLGLLAAIFLLIAVSVTSSEHVTVTMSGNGAAIVPEAPRVGTPGWVWLIIVPIGVVAASAPIGATIFGAVAIAQIKRSRGQLYGLPLAAGAAIFFPCLILGSIGFALTHLACIAVWTQTHMAYVVDGQSGFVNHIAPNPALRPDMTFLVLDMIVALVVGFFTGPAMWHAIAGVKKEVDATTSPEQP